MIKSLMWQTLFPSTSWARLIPVSWPTQISPATRGPMSCKLREWNSKHPKTEGTFVEFIEHPKGLMCWRDEGQMVEPVDVEIVFILTIISQDPWCVFFPHWCYTQWLQGWMLLLVNKVSWQHSLRTRAGSVEICHESCKELRIDYEW